MSPDSPPVYVGMENAKVREFIAAGDYSPLDTKFGKVMVLPIDGEHVNIEVRNDDFVVDGVNFRFALTLHVVPHLMPALVGRLTEWGSGGTFTERRRARILEEVFKRVNVAFNGPMAPAFEAARKRVLSNEIMSLDAGIEDARKKLTELTAKRYALLEEERELVSPPWNIDIQSHQ